MNSTEFQQMAWYTVIRWECVIMKIEDICFLIKKRAEKGVGGGRHHNAWNKKKSGNNLHTKKWVWIEIHCLCYWQSILSRLARERDSGSFPSKNACTLHDLHKLHAPNVNSMLSQILYNRILYSLGLSISKLFGNYSHGFTSWKEPCSNWFWQDQNSLLHSITLRWK